MNEALWLLGRGLGVSTLVLLTVSVVGAALGIRVTDRAPRTTRTAAPASR